MPKLAYTGQSHFRTISVAEFRDAGIEGEVKALHLIREEHEPRHNPKRKLSHVAEVSDEVAELLLKVEPNDWAIVEDEDDAAGKTADTPDAPEVQIVDGEAVVVDGGSGPSDTPTADASDAGSSRTTSARASRGTARS